MPQRRAVVHAGASAYGCRMPGVSCPPASSPSLCVCVCVCVDTVRLYTTLVPVRLCVTAAPCLEECSTRRAVGRATPHVHTHHALVTASTPCEGWSTVPGGCGAARCSYSTEVLVAPQQQEGEGRGRARDCSLRRPCPDRDRRGGAPAHQGTARTGTAHRHRHQRTPRPSPLHRQPLLHLVCVFEGTRSLSAIISGPCPTA